MQNFTKTLLLIAAGACLAAPRPSFGLQNFKTGKSAAPEVRGKHWLLVSEGCASCDVVLHQLKNFCGGAPPEPQKIGFFITGGDKAKMQAKLKDYMQKYEIWTGERAEFYKLYKMQGSPSLLAGGRVIVGGGAVLSYLKKDGGFCLKSSKEEASPVSAAAHSAPPR